MTLTVGPGCHRKKREGREQLAHTGRWAGEGASRLRAVEGEEGKKASWAGPQGGKKKRVEEK
jgi:hypothetical protein